MKVVLDTNVLLAAFATRGLCEAVFESCLAYHGIVLSEHILQEFRRHMRGKFKMPSTDVNALITYLRGYSVIIMPAKIGVRACRDRSDLPVLGTALGAKADCIVTGDRDLLDLKTFRGVPILSPRSFHDLLL